MKKSILLFCFVLLLKINLFAQLSGVGIRGGANFSMLSNTAPVDNIKTGFHAGVYVKWGISSFFMLQPEIMYSLKGTNSDRKDAPFYEYVNPNGNIELFQQKRIALNYIDLPIFARFNITKGFHALIGPQVSYLVHGLYKYSNFKVHRDIYDDIPKLNRWDIGIAGGLGYEFKMGLSLGARGSFGFIPLINGSKVRNSVVQLTAGFTLGGRKRQSTTL